LGSCARSPNYSCYLRINAKSSIQLYQLTAPDIIAGDGAYESIRIARPKSLGYLGAAQPFVLHHTHRLDSIGNVPGRENAGQTGKNRIGVERSVGLENSP